MIGLLVVGMLLFQSSAGAAYTCDSLLTPGPVESVTPRPATPTPAPTVAASPFASPSAAPTPGPSPAGPSPAGSPASPSAELSPDPAASPAASPAAPASPADSAAPGTSPSPGASPSPQPEPTARLGFTTTILGREHERNPNHTFKYGFCPPTSGRHFETLGPIPAQVYPSNREQSPGGWVHNLEHGYVVALYRCTGPDDCPTDAQMAEFQEFFDQATYSINEACPRKVVVARFDDMSTPYAMVAWGRALLMDEFDLDTALTFAQQWTDHEAVPERGAC